MMAASETASPGGLKYRCALSIAYGSGLRASEVVRLKPSGIDSERGVIRVEQGKGHKDRYALQSAASTLSCVFVSKSPASWRSRSCSCGSPRRRLTMRPRLTGSRAWICSAQRSTLV